MQRVIRIRVRLGEPLALHARDEVAKGCHEVVAGRDQIEELMACSISGRSGALMNVFAGLDEVSNWALFARNRTVSSWSATSLLNSPVVLCGKSPPAYSSDSIVGHQGGYVERKEPEGYL